MTHKQNVFHLYKICVSMLELSNQQKVLAHLFTEIDDGINK